MGRAAQDAMVIRVANNKLQKKALSENPTFNDFVKAGLAIESSDAQATKMQKEKERQFCRLTTVGS